MSGSRLLAIALASAIFGCASSYQPSGSSITGGFKETRLGPDVFRVTFSGNGYTPADRVQDFAMLRAAELTLANGAPFFVVMSTADRSRTETHVTPGTSHTTGTIADHGSKDKYSETTTYTPPRTETFNMPGVEMVIRTLQSKPDRELAFDAKFIVISIRAKYDLK
jgi:hypothetical protein